MAFHRGTRQIGIDLEKRVKSWKSNDSEGSKVSDLGSRGSDLGPGGLQGSKKVKKERFLGGESGKVDSEGQKSEKRAILGSRHGKVRKVTF